MKSKLANFTYTKDSGEKSSRRVITISEPYEMLMGFDLSNDDELDPEEIQFIKTKLNNIETLRNHDISKLALQYGLQIKTFKKSGISGFCEVLKKN